MKANLSFDYLNNTLLIPKSSDLQDIHITESVNIENTEDGPEVIVRCKNLTIDSGCIYSVANPCAGLTIIVNGDLVVNGIISLSQKGIARTLAVEKIYGLYGYKKNAHIDTGFLGVADNCMNTLKSYTIAAHDTQPGMGGVIKLYVKGDITIGAAGVISSEGASGADGGVVHIYYAGTFVNSGSVTVNGGSGGVVGIIAVEDISYLITEYRKTLATNEYIYTLIDLGRGRGMVGAKGTGKVYYTENYGIDWADQGQLGTATCVRCFVNLGNGHILAGVGSGSSSGAKIYETTDYGASGWALKATLGIQKRVSCMCYLGEGVLLAGTWDDGYIYKSTDYGANWVSRGAITSFNARSLLFLGGSNVLLGGRTGQIYLSVNSGDNWTLKATLSGAEKVRAFLLLPDGSILVGDQKGKIYKCNGSPYTTWTLQKTFYTKQEIQEFKSILNDKILVSMSPTKTTSTDTQKHVAVTEDSGTSWRIIDNLTSSLTNSYGINRQNILFQYIPESWINIPINHF
jgi:hypothetical protein